MQTSEVLKRKIGSSEDLLSVVKTMKALAAVSIRQYEKAVESLQDYTDTIDMGFQIALRNQPDIFSIRKPESTFGKTLAIIFGSEQGMVGQFNEQIISYASSQLSKLHYRETDRLYLAVGLRLHGDLTGSGVAVEDGFSMPGSVGGITPSVQEQLVKIENMREPGKVSRILLFYNKPRSKTGYRQHYIQLWPVDVQRFARLKNRPWKNTVLPTFTMDWNVLFSSLVRQYLFVTLFRAYAESLASENAGRLASMQAAERNIEESLEGFNLQFQHQRQSAITAELLDIISGFKALTGKKSKIAD